MIADPKREEAIWDHAFAAGCINRGIGLTRSPTVIAEIRRAASVDSDAVVRAWRRHMTEAAKTDPLSLLGTSESEGGNDE